MKHLLLVASAAAAGIFAAGRLVWRDGTRKRIRQLNATPNEDALSTGHAISLPAPVARYLGFAAPAAVVAKRRLTMSQRGELRGGVQDRWRLFKAVEIVSGGPPGFIWDTSCRIAPLVALNIRDCYTHGNPQPMILKQVHKSTLFIGPRVEDVEYLKQHQRGECQRPGMLSITGSINQATW
jgi:hypothetical protein